MADEQEVKVKFTGEASKLLRSMSAIAKSADDTETRMSKFTAEAIAGAKKLGWTMDETVENVMARQKQMQASGHSFFKEGEETKFIEALKAGWNLQSKINDATKAGNSERSKGVKLTADQAKLQKQIMDSMKTKGTGKMQQLPDLTKFAVSLQKAGASIPQIRKEMQSMGVDSETARAAIYRMEVELGTKLPAASKEAAIAIAQMGDRVQRVAGIKNINDQTNQIKLLMKDLIKTTGLTASQVGQLLAQIPGMQADAVRQATLEITNKMKGLKFMIRQTVGDISKAINTAFGVSFAMAFFQIAQVVQQFFARSLQRAKDFEKNLRELRLSEKLMSESGMEITNKQLDAMVQKIQDMGIGIAKVEAIDIVGQTGLILRNIKGITAEQVDMLSQSVAYLKVQDETVDAQVVLNAVLDRNDRAVNKLGVVFNDELITQKAIQMGLAKQGDVLSEIVKTSATIQLIYEQTAVNSEAFRESIKGTAKEAEILAREAQITLETNFGQSLLQISTQWKTFVVAIAPALDKMLWLFSVATKSVMAFVQILPLLDKQMTNTWKLLSNFINSGGLFNVDAQKENLKKWAEESLKIVDEVNKTIADAKVYEYAKVPENTVETPTGTGIGGDGALSDPLGLGDKEADFQESLKKMLEDLADFYDDMEKMEDDFILESARKWEDYQIDLARMKEDYEHDVLMVQQESNNDLAQENADYQNEELEAELKFQEEMRQLREKFLFDLEDALAARDARQVIRLQKQYAMDVTNKTNEYELEQQQRQRDHELEVQDIQNRVAERLAALKYEYDMKRKRAEEEFNLEQARARQDHQIDMQRREEEFDQRVEQWSAQIQEEFGIKAEGAALLLTELRKYYGTDGMFHEMYKASYDDILALGATFMKQLEQQVIQSRQFLASYSQAMGQTISPYSQGSGGGYLTPGTGSPYTNSGGYIPFAEGGMAIANQPTKAIFGEAGKEAAMFIPFNKMSQMMRGGANSPVGGTLEVEVGLSPDLVGRVVNASIEGVAEVITRVSRG